MLIKVIFLKKTKEYSSEKEDLELLLNNCEILLKSTFPAVIIEIANLYLELCPE